MLAGPYKHEQPELARRYELIFAAAGALEVHSVGRSLLRQAARVQAAVGGRLPDAIHVATAVETGCVCVVTTDAQMRTVPAAPLMLLADLAAAL